MVVVKWSAYLPSTLAIQVRILLTATVFSVKIVFEKNRNKQKETGLAFFKTKTKREVRFGPFFNKKKVSEYSLVQNIISHTFVSVVHQNGNFSLEETRRRRHNIINFNSSSFALVYDLLFSVCTRHESV